MTANGPSSVDDSALTVVVFDADERLIAVRGVEPLNDEGWSNVVPPVAVPKGGTVTIVRARQIQATLGPYTEGEQLGCIGVFRTRS